MLSLNLILNPVCLPRVFAVSWRPASAAEQPSKRYAKRWIIDRYMELIETGESDINYDYTALGTVHQDAHSGSMWYISSIEIDVVKRNDNKVKAVRTPCICCFSTLRTGLLGGSG